MPQMTQVIDHLDYGTGSIDWWKQQGWPLVKGTAEFWLDNLFVDIHTDDGTMVVNPCNSPEQAPITFGMRFRTSSLRDAEHIL